MSQARRTLSVLASIALGLVYTGHSLGQISQPAAPPSEATPVPPQVAPLEEQKLDQYAIAFVAIKRIEREARAQLSATKDPQASHQIKAKAEEQIIQAIERSGLQLNEFNQIAELAARDEALRLRLTDKVDKRRGG